MAENNWKIKHKLKKKMIGVFGGCGRRGGILHISFGNKKIEKNYFMENF
jgi:hypothetical protein